MADRWPFDEWRRNLSEVLSLSSAAAASLGLPQPGLLIGDPFTAIVDTARNWLIGKKRDVHLRFGRPDPGPEDLSVEGFDLAKAVGQLRPGPHARAGRRNRATPSFSSGFEIQAKERAPAGQHQTGAGGRADPLEAFLSAAAALPRWLAAYSPRLELATRGRPPGRHDRGAVGTPGGAGGAEGKSIRIVPRALHLLDRRVSVLRIPAFHVPLPELPFDVMLTSVAGAGGFVVRGLLPEWARATRYPGDLERLLATMRGGQDQVQG